MAVGFVVAGGGWECDSLQFLAIWMPRNVVIPMFGFIRNLLRFLGMWNDNVWFIPRNLKWIIYFSHSIFRFKCELLSPFALGALVNNPFKESCMGKEKKNN